MKSIKRIVDTEIWNSNIFIDELTPEDKYFYLYLLTNTHTSQLGVYKVAKKIMAFETGYSIDTINLLIDRFENVYEMIKYNPETSEVAIKNYLKHSIIKGGKPVMDCLKRDKQRVIDKSLIDFSVELLFDDEEINETAKAFINTECIHKHNHNHKTVDVSSNDSSLDTTEKVVNEKTWEEEFEIIYQSYPKKGTKQSAKTSYHKWVQKSGKKVDGKVVRLDAYRIWEGVNNYVKQQEEKGTDLQYYKNFSTLMNQILDYIEE